MANANTLSAQLKPRHITMLSIAGVIGAGLFVASGHAIAAAGPAVLLSYLMAGALVVLVMRMLGEMAVASPSSGSFSTYAQRGIGRWAGFTIGWLYWWFWVLVIPVEATAAAAILHSWFPGAATWEFALGITVVLTVTNLFGVASYGEFEFWFALLKVLAIVAFIALGAAALLGLLPERQVDGLASLMAQHDGFMPNGFHAVIGGLMATMFSFMGAEIVTIAAAESQDPADKISRATNSVIWRIGLFYLASIFLVVSIVPFDDPRLKTVGSFQRTLELLAIPHAKALMDCVVLVAVGSCLNSSLYTASRMLYSLGRRRYAPSWAGRTSVQGVPRAAVLGSTLVGFFAIIANYAMPEAVFSFLLSTSGAVALLIYLVIAISQLRLRSALPDGGASLTFRMWLFPGLTWLVILFIIAALGLMLLSPAHRPEMLATGTLAMGIALVGLHLGRRQADRSSLDAPQTG